MRGFRVAQRRQRSARLNELDASVDIVSGQGLTATIKLPPWLKAA